MVARESINPEDKLIDQTQLAEDVSHKISYEFTDCFLVKPLPVIMVKKEFTKLPNTAPVKDENGVEAVEVDKEPETEIKEVESNFRKGVVLKVPFNYINQMNSEDYPSMPIKIGDIIVYRSERDPYFDILKDTHLVKAFSVIAVEKNGHTEDK